MKKILFITLLVVSSGANAALVTKDLYVAENQVRIFMEYDNVTLRLSTSPLHCVNTSSKNASFKFTAYGTNINSEVVFPANTTGTGLFGNSIGLISIADLSSNNFDLLQGYFSWPR